MIIKHIGGKLAGRIIIGGLLIFVTSTLICQISKANSKDPNHKNPNGRNDAWGFVGAEPFAW